jgi:predicted  nucleic acid-binding Zn-ribbon protein
VSPTPEQRAARSALLRARKKLRDAMADVAIMEEVTKPYREALAAAEAEAERARDDFNRVCGKSAV